MRPRSKQGFSLVETLVVLVIILILMALYLPTLAKAMRKAKEVAGKEAVRQHGIGKMADGANIAKVHGGEQLGRTAARNAFRQELDIGKDDTMIVSELLYVVTNDDEFRAYYHTLLNPHNSAPLTYASGGLNAFDEDNNLYVLPYATTIAGRSATTVMAWEFISTDLTETSSGTIGGTVLYSDGHSGYVRYPDEFPMTPTVAELSHAFMQD